MRYNDLRFTSFLVTFLVKNAIRWKLYWRRLAYQRNVCCRLTVWYVPSNCRMVKIWLVQSRPGRNSAWFSQTELSGWAIPCPKAWKLTGLSWPQVDRYNYCVLPYWRAQSVTSLSISKYTRRAECDGENWINFTKASLSGSKKLRKVHRNRLLIHASLVEYSTYFHFCWGAKYHILGFRSCWRSE